jgi:hypothetical protein
MNGELYDGLENMLGKLHVLRDSCTGIRCVDESDPNLIWFQGAASIIQEAIDELHKALRALEKGEVKEPATTVEKKKEEEPEEEEE